MDNAELYQLKIKQYKRKQQEIEIARRARRDSDYINFLDIERDNIHRELRSLAQDLGKSTADVDIDLLVSESDLAEYGCPEFKLTLTAEALTDPEINIIHGDNVIDPDANETEPITTEEDLHRVELFIPFGEDVYWHLFDCEMFRGMNIDGPERRRRALKAIGLIPANVHFVEIFSPETFHNATAFFGIGFSAEDKDRVLDFLSQIKEEVSINESEMDPEQLRDDLAAVLKKEIRQIHEYIEMNIKNFGKTEYYETEAALVNDLKNKYFLKIGKHPGLRAITEPIFAEGLERAVLNDKRNLVFAEESLAEVNPFLDEYEKMPKFESFGKRL